MASSNAAPGARLRLERVSLVLGGFTILDDLDLELAAPGFTVIAGPSGSGKSSMLRLCNRLLAPSAGAVRFDGTDLTALDVAVLRRRVGMVFQRPAVFDGSCLDNLAVACPGADRPRYADGLSAVGLDAALLDRSARSLSGGEAQRLCLARTLLTEPEVLLMDEPTSALDVDSRQRIEGLARALADAGRPVLWVTHDLDQARRLGDRLVVLAGGRVQPDDVAEVCLERGTFEGLPPRGAGATGGAGDDHD